MTEKDIHEYLLNMPGAWLDFPFGEDVFVYKVGPKGDEKAKMFALVANNSKPLRVSLKCDPQLSQILREKYESVMPGYHLNKKHWNTILCTGQVSDEDLRSLMTMSFDLASSK